MMNLTDKRIDDLTALIKDSFRVRPNQDPVYVDVGGNMPRVTAKQHQIVFGRRGSGATWTPPKPVSTVDSEARDAPGETNG